MEKHLIKSRSFICDVGNCGKSYKWKADLTRHKYDRHNILPHKCKFCNKYFRIFPELRDHLNEDHYVENGECSENI